MTEYINYFGHFGRTPWTGDRSIARPLYLRRTAQQTNKKTRTHIHASSGIRSHDPSVKMEAARSSETLHRVTTQKTTAVRTSGRLLDNIEMDFKETGCEVSRQETLTLVRDFHIRGAELSER